MSSYTIPLDVAALLLIYGLFAYLKLLPNIIALQDFANLLNSKGGNILVLLALSILFFGTGMRMTYWCLDKIIEQKLTLDNAVMMMGINFITGSCFGGAFSSMLKVMSGETPTPPTGTSVSTTSTVVASEAPKASTETTKVDATTETPKS